MTGIFPSLMLITTAMTTPYKLTIIPFTNPPPVPPPPPAIPVPNSYWDRIKHEKRPAGTVNLSYRERIDNGLVTIPRSRARGNAKRTWLVPMSLIKTPLPPTLAFNPIPCHLPPHPPRPPARLVGKSVRNSAEFQD
jgi:hypothetical protein